MGTGVAVPRKSWWAQASQNRLIALVLAMVVIVPLIASPADTRLAGVAVLAFEGLAILLLVALLWRTRFELSRERVVTFLRTGANLPVVLFLALAAVSCILSPQKAFSVQELLKLGAGVLLYFVAAYHFRQSKHLSMLVDVLLFLAITISLLGMGQYTMNPEARGTALFGNQQPLGSLLMILLPMVAVIAITDKDLKRQLVAQVATVMTIGCLLLAHTRSAWVGAAVGLMALGLLAVLSAARQGNLAAQRGNLSVQKHKLVLPLMLVVVSAGFFALMNTQNSSVVERAGTLPLVSAEESWRERSLQWWPGTIEMIKARPLTGVGLGLYPVYQTGYTGLGAAVLPNERTDGVRVSLAEQAHNFYLQTAAELGLPGLVLILAILASFFLAGLNRVDKMDAGIRHSLLMGSMASIAAFAVDAVTSPSWQLGQVSMFMWLILGIGVSCIRPRPKAEEEVAPVVEFSPRVGRPFSLATACVGLMALMSTYNFASASHFYNRECKATCRAQFDCGEDQRLCLEQGEGDKCKPACRAKFDCGTDQRLCLERADATRAGCRSNANRISNAAARSSAQRRCESNYRADQRTCFAKNRTCLDKQRTCLRNCDRGINPNAAECQEKHRRCKAKETDCIQDCDRRIPTNHS